MEKNKGAGERKERKKGGILEKKERENMRVLKEKKVKRKGKDETKREMNGWGKRSKERIDKKKGNRKKR